jgi:hypothetical protein
MDALATFLSLKKNLEVAYGSSAYPHSAIRYIATGRGDTVTQGPFFQCQLLRG